MTLQKQQQTSTQTSEPMAATEIGRRRTFAIISHPDAGKTTLTEKLLLYGGAIQLAGHVKARGQRRHTRSDWMAIEQARGISVTSSVMTFEHEGAIFNLLDTPGHSDFSEDTYRTLSAVDAAIMVIDAAKGIESQTRKLFEVCRLRDIPILTFINKVDREGLDRLALLDDISLSLALDVTPITWPIGTGSDFRGVIDLDNLRLLLPETDRTSPFGRVRKIDHLAQLAEAPELDLQIAAPVLEEILVATGALPRFDRAAFLEGSLSPVFFGSALRNFGIAELLHYLTEFAPGPQPRPADARVVNPTEGAVTGFVFKVQANMDPHHRDRMAFVRLCSGHFQRGKKLFHVRENRWISVMAPVFFFAQSRETADDAFAGDIVGIPNHGTLRVGDTLTEGERLNFAGLPNFAPEVLRRVHIEDPLRVKPLNRALNDLAEEGVVQVLHPVIGAPPILGAIGELQFDVLKSRLMVEYGVPVRFESIGLETVRWVVGKNHADTAPFEAAHRLSLARDKDGFLVYLAKNAWTLARTEADWPNIEFSDTRERAYDRIL